MEIRGHSGKGINRVGLPWPILHREVKLGELGSPSLLKGTQGGSSEMDQGVVVCEDIELGAQEVVTKLLCDCPFKGQEFQLHAGVVGLVLLCWTQPSTCVGQDPSLPILILREDGTQPVMAGVCFEDEGLGELCKPQDRSCSQGCLRTPSGAAGPTAWRCRPLSSCDVRCPWRPGHGGDQQSSRSPG